MAVYRTGRSSYAPLLPGTTISGARPSLLFRAHGRAQQRLLGIDYEGLSRGYTRVPGFSMADVVTAYERALAAELANDNSRTPERLTAA